jgi:poly-gamma-glutamate synthesis protein (capsule biosynthesis protein)
LNPRKNTGWLLRMELDRQGVRHWQTVVAHIDRQGTPHPLPAQANSRE